MLLGGKCRGNAGEFAFRQIQEWSRHGLPHRCRVLQRELSELSNRATGAEEPVSTGAPLLPEGLFESSEEDVQGAALHFYLSRESNMNLSTVKMLIGLCPESLSTSCPGTRENELLYFPIHALAENPNIGQFESILRYIIVADPASLRYVDSHGQVPLHIAIDNDAVTANIIEILVNGWKQTTHERDCSRNLPIHLLCQNESLNEMTKLAALRVLIEAYPESLLVARGRDGRNRNWQGLPIHLASRYQNSAFCKVLIDSCPETLRASEHDFGRLPIHIACESGYIDTVKYLLEADPESINAATQASGYYPIHCASRRGLRNNRETQGRDRSTFEVTEYLLQIDPNCASKRSVPAYIKGSLPLDIACRDWSLKTVKLLFDAYPEAVYSLTTREWSYRSAMRFIDKQLNDFSALSEASFPIHRAICSSSTTIGVVKLLINKVPDQVQAVDDEGQLPLHLACKYGMMAIVECLVGIDQNGPLACDLNQNRPLHYACQFGHYHVVNYLLKANTVSVSERNSDGKLPFQLLIEATTEKEKDDLAYIEAIWRLLVASPDVVPRNL